MATVSTSSGNVTAIMTVGIFLMKTTAPLWHALQGKQSAETVTSVLTPSGCVMEIMIVLTSGMKVKLCAIEPAALVAFVVLQGIVSPCTGAVMVKMTVETAVMNISVHITIRLVLVTSSLVAIVSDLFFLDLPPLHGNSPFSNHASHQQAPVVQIKVDNAIHWINHCQMDNAIIFANSYPLDSDLSNE